MATSRRGRPYQVPEDLTPMRGTAVDVDARVGWLLLMSRLHHPDHDLALGEAFNAALKDVGLQADRSAVSRWESGKVTPRWAVLTAYEQALHLPTGQLTSVVNALRRAYTVDRQAAWMPVLDPQACAFHERLDELFDVLMQDAGTGPEWTELGHHLAAATGMYVHGAVWEGITSNLIDQLTRSVGIPYLQRFEAVRILLDQRVAQPWMLRATADYLDDPAVQIVTHPIGVMAISEAPEAAEQLLEQFAETTSEPVFEACVWAVAHKVVMGHYTSRQLDRIEGALVRAIRRPDVGLAGLEELLVAMPESYRARLLQAARGVAGHEHLASVVTHGELFRPEATRRVSQRLADEVRSRLETARLYDEDRMTPRLIREALFSASSDRRHFASVALLGTPFRPHLAAALVDEIEAAGPEDPIVPTYATLLRYLATPAEEPAMLGWLTDAPPAIARSLAMAIGHLPATDRDLGVLSQRIEGDASLLDRALLYGLGMRESTELDRLLADKEQPAFVHEAAGWWKCGGGAVHR